MNIKHIQILAEAEKDLVNGRTFYETAYIIAILPERRNPTWLTQKLKTEN